MPEEMLGDAPDAQFGRHSIISESLGPGLFRVCPKCRSLFALRYAWSEEHRALGEIRYFKCRKCSHVVAYERHHPPNVV